MIRIRDKVNISNGIRGFGGEVTATRSYGNEVEYQITMDNGYYEWVKEDEIQKNKLGLNGV